MKRKHWDSISAYHPTRIALILLRWIIVLHVCSELIESGGGGLEMCVGMGKTGIPWVPLFPMGMGIKTWEWGTYITTDCKLFRRKISHAAIL